MVGVQNLLLPVSEPQKGQISGQKCVYQNVCFAFTWKIALPPVKTLISWKNAPKTQFYSFFSYLLFYFLVFLFF